MFKKISSTRVHSAELLGTEAQLIDVEVDIYPGIHSFIIVGLADKTVSEAKERVNSAIKNAGIKPPSRENRRITINFAPAGIKKNGPQYDLAIAVGYLLATNQINEVQTHNKIFIGELSLSGNIRGIRGALSIAQMAAVRGFTELFLPSENAAEASIIEGVRIIPLNSLRQLIDHLYGSVKIMPAKFVEETKNEPDYLDISEIHSQESAKRGLIIAAAGGHNLLMVGPPGVGKSMLARALPGLLPDLSIEESIEVTKIYSVAGGLSGGLLRSRPFRSPNHTSSIAAMLGGGPELRPGEISLAHRGVLFLDELAEFPRNVTESLREPMEEGIVVISRSSGIISFPARFTLIAATNPCHCGFFGDPEKTCICSPADIFRYQKRISGPLFDRIDLQVKVSRPTSGFLKNKSVFQTQNTTALAGEVIKRARKIQLSRFSRLKIEALTNSELTSSQIEEIINESDVEEGFLKKIYDSGISPRGYFRVLKTARTIADLDGLDRVEKRHLAEALSYRLGP